MLHWLRGKRATKKPVESPIVPADRMPVAMSWLPGSRLPIVDWELVGEQDDPAWDRAQRERFWTSAAEHWLEALADTLPPGYMQRRGGDFLLLSTLPPRTAQLLLRSCQGALLHIKRSLGPLTSDEGCGPYVVIVFADEDTYYEYASHYYPDGGEYAMSSGMFIHAGYGHFITHESELDQSEPVVVHELTHALLSHLPIPLWLNEGLAVNVEHALFPRLADPRNAMHSYAEMLAMRKAYWNDDTIQGFWSGEAFHEAGDGVALAYDLARAITKLAARDESAFRAFVAEAHWRDAGVEAEPRLGYPLAHLVEAVLGEGDWQPVPERWQGGSHEAGQ